MTKAMTKIEQITIEELLDIPEPLSTKSYLGIPHSYVYEKARGIGDDAGFTFEKSQIEVSRDRRRAFIKLFFTQEGCDEYFFIGARSTYDKSARVAFACGASVMVCSNLCIYGSDMIVMRKHTLNAIQDIEEQVITMTGNARETFERICAFGKDIKKVNIPADQGKMIIGASLGRGIIPHNTFLQAMSHWENAPFEEFKGDRTLWGVYNALTYGTHGLPVNKSMDTNAAITGFIESVYKKQIVLV